MAGWPDIAEDDEQLVAEIVVMTKSIRGNWTAWRARINANGILSGQESAQRFQELTSYRTFMSSKVGSNAAGITAAYLRRRPSLGSFDAAARWAEQKATIDAFVTWFKTGWPHVTTLGYPAFHRLHAVTEELEDLPTTLNPGQKTAVLAQIDVVLTAFTSS